jgi:ribosomal protein S18 acetylase RimI-like enzyme
MSSPTVVIRPYRPSDLVRCHELLKFGYDSLYQPAVLGALKSRLALLFYTLTALTAFIFPVYQRFLFAVPVLYMFFVPFYVSKLFCGWRFFVFNGDMKNPKLSFQHGNSNFWVAEIQAEDQEQVIGCIGFHAHSDGSGEMTRLTVAKRFRRLKIASKLVETVLEWAKDKGIKRIELETTCYQQPAIKLYERYGFVIERVANEDWGMIGLKVLKLGISERKK